MRRERALIYLSYMLILAGVALAAAPAQASSYDVNFTLYAAQEQIWAMAIPVEAGSASTTLAIPQGLYNLIFGWYGTDTFTTPFTIDVPMDSLSLQVNSNPTGLATTFKKMNLGDINDDGIVDIYDIMQTAAVYGDYNMFVDVNFDLRIDIYDLVNIAVNFGRTY